MLIKFFIFFIFVSMNLFSIEFEKNFKKEYFSLKENCLITVIKNNEKYYLIHFFDEKMYQENIKIMRNNLLLESKLILIKELSKKYKYKKFVLNKMSIYDYWENDNIFHMISYININNIKPIKEEDDDNNITTLKKNSINNMELNSSIANLKTLNKMSKIYLQQGDISNYNKVQNTIITIKKNIVNTAK